MNTHHTHTHRERERAEKENVHTFVLLEWNIYLNQVYRLIEEQKIQLSVCLLYHALCHGPVHAIPTL